MTYTIECRRLNTPGHWLILTTHRKLADAKVIAQDLARELRREIRVMTYGSLGFRIIAEYSDTGEPLWRDFRFKAQSTSPKPGAPPRAEPGSG